MRATLPFLAAALWCLACGPLNVQQQAGFGRSEIRPAKERARVGELVRFDLRPPVSQGTEWDLDTYHRVRFADDSSSTHRFWLAEHEPIHLEAIIAPWDARTAEDKSESTGWLWYALRDAGEKEPINRPVPVQRERFEELAPVAVTSAFSIQERSPRLSYTRATQRNEIAFKTTTDIGNPHLPRVRAALGETGGKKILYAEIRLDLGVARKESVGYETTLTYPLNVEGPLEVVIVEWVGHGDYFGPFQVHRLNVPG